MRGTTEQKIEDDTENRKAEAERWMMAASFDSIAAMRASIEPISRI